MFGEVFTVNETWNPLIISKVKIKSIKRFCPNQKNVLDVIWFWNELKTDGQLDDSSQVYAIAMFSYDSAFNH